MRSFRSGVFCLSASLLLSVSCATAPHGPGEGHESEAAAHGEESSHGGGAHGAKEADAPHWTYEGETGAEHWADLNPDYAPCRAGSQQSPIDIAGAAGQGLTNIDFHYQPSGIKLLNNGHTIQFAYDPGSYIEVDGDRYDLLQFHFHAPSEHRISGALADAEVHLVHKSSEGRLAVVGVMLKEGSENQALGKWWLTPPTLAGQMWSVPGKIEAAKLLPRVQTTFRYAGSLTTPPCSEGVKWMVMTEPMQMSSAQLASFTNLYAGSNRPVQPLQGRTVARDTTP